MTGQPQLSMGELVTAAGSLAMGTFKGAKAAGHITKEGSRKVAQGAVNAHGTAAKMNSARKAASSSAKDLGASVAQQRMAGAKGMFAAASTDLKDKVRSAGNNFFHGGGIAGPGGHGGGAGARTRTRRFKNLEQHFESNLPGSNEVRHRNPEQRKHDPQRILRRKT